MPTYTAAIIDTESIQSYVFGSNKLKDNIGASYIIEKLIYRQLMIEVLEQKFKDGFKKEWENETFETIHIIDDDNCQCEIGYTGGGNALLLFKKEKDAKKFIYDFSLHALSYFPGLRLAFGIKPDFRLTDNFKNDMESLHKNLLHNKNLSQPNVTVFKHGIVEDCPRSNEAQERKYNSGKLSFSTVTMSKLKAAAISQQGLEALYKEELKNGKYTFPDELENLGQLNEKGYIAIVHIDGNGMGQEFRDQKDLPSLRLLSKKVSDLAWASMRELTQHITTELFDKKGDFKGFEEFDLKKSPDQTKILLPIRPLITGGDDITFICEGRLGIHLAEKFIKIFGSKTEEALNKKITACAGVAIVKTKYPFFRAYKLAEELLRKAKEKYREQKEIENKNESSWLSYIISPGGFSGSLENILEQKFATLNGNLTQMPYKLDDESDGLEQLKAIIKQFHGNWPVNKLMQLRDMLTKDKASRKYFLAEIKARQLQLPKYNGTNDYQCLWKDRKTPFYDAIELKDFYPKHLL